MKDSIKIDIIYFRTKRDTRMEFMFKDSGELPIRMLTSAADDRTEFLYALKRAVFRSDSIIIVGGLNGEQYLPGLLSSAIGVPCEKVDYRALGFEESEKPLMFPSKSIPLVTQDHEIGGFLIEKGRQAIIMLSEDFDVRLKLLKSLVLPYVLDSKRARGNTSSAAPADRPQAVSETKTANDDGRAAEPAEVIKAPDEVKSGDPDAADPEYDFSGIAAPETGDGAPAEVTFDFPELDLTADEAEQAGKGPDSEALSAEELQSLLDSLPDPAGNKAGVGTVLTDGDNAEEDLNFDDYLDLGRRIEVHRYINIGAAAALIIAGLAIIAVVLLKLL